MYQELRQVLEIEGQSPCHWGCDTASKGRPPSYTCWPYSGAGGGAVWNPGARSTWETKVPVGGTDVSLPVGTHREQTFTFCCGAAENMRVGFGAGLSESQCWHHLVLAGSSDES